MEDDFYELGGHSLRATQVVSRLRQAFGVELALFAVFELRTPAALARAKGLPDATLFGDRLHLLADENLSQADLLARLAPDYPGASLRPIAPTLEDVFVLLSRKETAREKAGTEA